MESINYHWNCRKRCVSERDDNEKKWWWQKLKWRWKWKWKCCFSIFLLFLIRRRLFCPTLTKWSKWQITQIWESDVFRLVLAYSTSNPSLEQKHSFCWKIIKSRHNDIALMSMYVTDTFCSFTTNFIFTSCFFLSEYGSINVEAIERAPRTWWLFVDTSLYLPISRKTILIRGRYMITRILWVNPVLTMNEVSLKYLLRHLMNVYIGIITRKHPYFSNHSPYIN